MAMNIQSAFAAMSSLSGRHHHNHRVQPQESQETAATEVAPSPSSGGLVMGQAQSAEDTARNILAHVQQGLDVLRADGADPQRLASRVDAARSGIATGYADAREMLEGMGLLTDELAAEIDRGEAMVYEGLEQLAAGETPDLLAPVPVTVDEETDNALQPVFSASAQRTSNRMSLEVMTRDGDRVKVDFSQRQGSLQLSAGGLSLSASAFSEKWSMSVEGSLDDGEMQALEQLFSDVQSLSDKFFGGDLGAALEEAMQLGFDGNELASMSLDLRQRSFSSVSRAYGSSAPELPTEALQSQKSYLADYVDSYIRALDRAAPLAEPRQTLREMLEQLTPQEPLREVMNRFNDGLNRLI